MFINVNTLTLKSIYECTNDNDAITIMKNNTNLFYKNIPINNIHSILFIPVEFTGNECYQLHFQ